MLFLSRTPPTLTKDSKGEWTVTLLCVDRIATQQVESWRIFWKGQQAANWFDDNKTHLTPGTPLVFMTENLRTHTMGKFSEITAKATAVALVNQSEAA
ncbi:hypothetical protein B9Z48_05260 [Limnohabitans sp. WS1]|nr:hypothetical protein B9Z48_05260 [Limnohabitans sp. WS1]